MAQRIGAVLGILAAAMASAQAAESELEHELERELNRMPPPATLPLPESLACYQRLSAIARFEVLPIRSSPSQCATIDLVRIERVRMPDQSEVALAPPPALRCSMAEAIAEWVRADVGPAAAELGAPLAVVTDLDSYQCRPRNNIPGAKLSEHGKANALDVGEVRLQNGEHYVLTDPAVPKPFREAVKAAACARFMTVLGPGSDSFHNNHIHLDLEERSHNYKICQWNVLDRSDIAGNVPLPRPRPADLGAGGAATDDASPDKSAEAKPAETKPADKPSVRTRTLPPRRRRPISHIIRVQ